MSLINNPVMRPAKPINDLIELTPYQLKVREIEELERKIDKLTERLLLMKTEISYTPHKSTRRLWMKDILLAVCSYMDFTPAEVTGPKRYKDLVQTRSLYLNLCLELTNHGVTHIARTCGDRDHTTVCYHQRIKQEKSKYWSVTHDEGIKLWSDYSKIKQELVEYAEGKR